MDFTRAELKEQAKAQLSGKVGMIFLCMLVVGVVYSAYEGIASVIMMSSGEILGSLLLSIGSILLTPPLTVGMILLFLNITYGDEPNVGMVFEPFKKCFGKSIALTLLVEIFISLWTLLLIIPGIVMAYAYSQAFRIMLENPDLTPMECIRESKRIMYGRKMDLFVLHLSFLPWLLLCIVTIGFASIYVFPYMTLTETNFYHRIKNSAFERY